MFLPWHINAGLGGNQTVRGVSTGIGRILLVICIVTVVLVQLRWRPAWIGAGFAGAIAIRELVSPSGVGSPDPGLGPQIAFIHVCSGRRAAGVEHVRRRRCRRRPRPR